MATSIVLLMSCPDFCLNDSRSLSFIMSSDADQKLEESINRFLTFRECATEFQWDSNNQIDFSLPDNLLKAIEILRSVKEYELSDQ